MKRKFISLILAVAMAVCFIPCAAKVYAEEMSVRIILNEPVMHAGSSMDLEVEVNGGSASDLVWSLSGNQSSGTQVLRNEMSIPTGDTIIRFGLYIALDETAEEIIIRAAFDMDPSVYDEVTIRVLPPNYINRLELSNAADALFINSSMMTIEAVNRFIEALEMDYPVPHQGLENHGITIFKLSDDHEGELTDASQLERCDYDAYFDEDSEYYFMMRFTTNKGYHYHPDGINITYNGNKVDFWQFETLDPTMIDVYVKASMGFGEDIKIYSFGVDGGIDVSGNTITADGSRPLKAAYFSDGELTAISASENGDGTYSFTVPEGVAEVVLVVKGDANGDGSFTNLDVTIAKAAMIGRAVKVDAFGRFASDISGDNDFTNYDVTLMKAMIMGRIENGWT